MIILGLDPGTTAAGYAVLAARPEALRAPRLYEAGVLEVSSPESGERLAQLHRSLKRLMERCRPEAVAIEKLFFAANSKTAMAVAEARGVLLLTAKLASATVYEYTPAEIKKTITGQGNADKNQIRKMIILTLPDARRLRARDDTFDAIASALTYCFKQTPKGRIPQTP